MFRVLLRTPFYRPEFSFFICQCLVSISNFYSICIFFRTKIQHNMIDLILKISFDYIWFFFLKRCPVHLIISAFIPKPLLRRILISKTLLSESESCHPILISCVLWLCHYHDLLFTLLLDWLIRNIWICYSRCFNIIVANFKCACLYLFFWILFKTTFWISHFF